MLRKLTVAALFMMLPASLAAAQAPAAKAPAADPAVDAAIAQLRKDAAAGKNDIINANMEFTAAENAAFWPLYKAYDQKRQAIGNEKVALIKDFATNYNTLSDAKAKELVAQSLGIEDKTAAARRQFLQDLSKALPAKKVARYYQVENRIELLVGLAFAEALPLTK